MASVSKQDDDQSGKAGADPPRVVNAATTDWDDVLVNAAKGRKAMPMQGFDDEFVDIVDYILRITYWIWHEKKVDLCLKYYAPTSKLHTMTGDILGNQIVVDNTWATLRAFPDRTLDAENIVWGRLGSPDNANDDEPPTYYTSHLIVSRMTNMGDSEWGPATGKRARIRTIADCVCQNNVIVEEWLMRDNALLVMKLGYDVKQVAYQQAMLDVHTPGKTNLLDFLAPERARVRASDPLPTLSQGSSLTASGGDGNTSKHGDDDVGTTPLLQPQTDPVGFAKLLMGTIWEGSEYGRVKDFYDFRVTAHLTAGRELYGTLEMIEYLQEFLQGLTDVKVSIDHVAKTNYLDETSVDIAVRWTLTATHSEPSELWGKQPVGTPVYILASSHWRVVRGHKIREEWTVFDELAIHRQLATGRLLQNAQSV